MFHGAFLRNTYNFFRINFMAHIITKPRCAVCSVWKVWILWYVCHFRFLIFSILILLDRSMRIIKNFFHFIFCWFFNSFTAIKCSLSLFFSYEIPTNYFKFLLNQKCNCLQILRGLFRFLYESNLWLCFRVGVFYFKMKCIAQFVRQLQYESFYCANPQEKLFCG